MDIIPQLDGPTSVCIRRRSEQEPIRSTTTIPRGDILMRVRVILMIIGDLMMDEGPLEEEDNDITIGVEGCQIEGITMIEVILEEEDP